MTKPVKAKGRSAPPPRPAAKKKAAPPPPPPPPGRPGWLIPAAVVGLVLVLFAVALVATRLGDGDGDGAEDTNLLQVRPVSVSGTSLPGMPNQGPDPATGMQAPVVTGASFDGHPVVLGRTGRPAMVFFVAHWCPHCRREVPLLAPELRRITPPGVEVLTVATATRENDPNYPPSKWLRDEEWPTPVLADDAKGSAASAYGLTGYPFFVLLDREGKVAARGSGEKTVAEVEALLKQVAPGG
jgi:cytochrome c biogenesis protein CcmG/thiol:disulfide interchange protein DsbE